MSLLDDLLKEDTEEVEEEEFEPINEDFIHDEETIAKASSTLNEEQLTVFNKLLRFTQHPDKNYIVLVGYAGTGKTYSLSKFISALTSKCKIAMTAPTNKAVKVLVENKPAELANKVTYSTIHKLLSLRMQWVYPKRNQNFKPYQKLVRNKWGISQLNDYNLLIIDETSMLDDDLFMMMHKEKREDLKVIFMGDPAQIPPVNRDDSIPLLAKQRTIFNIEDLYLKKIMRQKADNKLLLTASQIREGRFEPGDPLLSRVSNKDCIFLSTNSERDIKAFNNEMIRLFTSDDFQKDPNFCKTISWTNATVGKYNRIIREAIFDTKSLEPLMEGEKLIADTPVIKDEDIIFNTSDEFEVLSYEEKTTFYKPPDGEDKAAQTEFDLDDDLVIQSTSKDKKIYIKYFRTLVKHKISEGEYIEKKIDILNEESEKQLKWIFSKCFKTKRFDEYREWSEKFAKVKYNYAITAHKSQGSTYGTVFLIEDDIDKNPKNLERNRIKYTACTRPKDRLIILSSRNRPIEQQKR